MEKGSVLASQGPTTADSPLRESGSSGSALYDSRLVLGCLLALGVLLSVINLRWPVARNALDYMKAALEIVTSHFDLIAVSRDHVSIGGKPLLFSLVATPLVWLLGGNSGIIATSVIGTCVFLIAVVFTLDRLFGINGYTHSRWTSLGVTLVGVNPLVMYQFWSGYPDSLFAGLVLLAFVLSDTIVEGDRRRGPTRVVLLGVTICLAVHTKLYGIVLMLACPVYILARSSRSQFRQLWLNEATVAFGVVWLLLSVVLILAKFGYDPLLVFDSSSGFGDYIASLEGPAAVYAVDSLKILLFSILLAFHVALTFLLKKEAWDLRSMAPIMFIGIYIAGLLPSMGTGINMRYFLPVFPFVAFMLASGASAASPAVRRAILCGYVVVAVVLVLNFNLERMENMTQGTITSAYSRYPDLARWLDNLRLPVHIALKRQIDAINKNVPDGGTLYWSSDYYKTATHGLAYDLGVKRTLKVKYVLEPSYPQYTDQPVFLTVFTSTEPPAKLWRPPNWATPTSYGHGLFLLDPTSVRLSSLSGDFVAEGQPIEIRAEMNSGDPYTVRGVEFVESGIRLARVERPPFEMTWSNPPSGRHEVVARVDYANRDAVFSSPLDIYVGVPALERIAGDTDDLIEEYDDGILQATQNLLFLNQKLRVGGVRFRDISIPRGTRIASAHLVLTSAQVQTGRTTIDIRAELSPNAKGLRLVDGDLSMRPRTSAHVVWEVASWAAGQKAESPDLASILEEVFAQKEWQSGNSILLLVQVWGNDRTAEAATEDGVGIPRLQITLGR